MWLNFFYAAGMSASFKRGVKESLDHLKGLFYGCKAGGDSDHIGIVVFSCQGGDLLIPAESAAHFGVLIYGHGHSVATSTDNNTPVGLSLINHLSYGVCKVRIIHALGGVGTHVGNIIML